MAESSFAVFGLLLLKLNFGNHFVKGQSTIGDCINDEHEKYFSSALSDLAKSVQSEFKDLKAQLVDRDNRVEIQKLPGSRCPTSFNFSVAAFPKCYAVLFPAVSWNTAQQRCRQLHKDAHLAVINGALEQQIISKIMLNYDCPIINHDAKRVERSGNFFWIGGQLQNVSSCNSTFIWKPNNRTSLPIGYTNWNSGEPNCAPLGLIENCLGIRPDGQWNDLACSWNFCPVCEVTVYN